MLVILIASPLTLLTMYSYNSQTYSVDSITHHHLSTFASILKLFSTPNLITGAAISDANLILSTTVNDSNTTIIENSTIEEINITEPESNNSIPKIINSVIEEETIADEFILDNLSLDSQEILDEPLLSIAADVAGCMEINLLGRYTLTQNINVSETGFGAGTDCFQINSDDVVLDGAGFIVYGNLSGLGLRLNTEATTNVTLTNLDLRGFNEAIISSFNASNLTLEHSYLYTDSSSQGVLFDCHSSNCNVTLNNNTFESDRQGGGICRGVVSSGPTVMNWTVTDNVFNMTNSGMGSSGSHGLCLYNVTGTFSGNNFYNPIDGSQEWADAALKITSLGGSGIVINNNNFTTLNGVGLVGVVNPKLYDNIFNRRAIAFANPALDVLSVAGGNISANIFDGYLSSDVVIIRSSSNVVFSENTISNSGESTDNYDFYASYSPLNVSGILCNDSVLFATNMQPPQGVTADDTKIAFVNGAENYDAFCMTDPGGNNITMYFGSSMNSDNCEDAVELPSICRAYVKNVLITTGSSTNYVFNETAFANPINGTDVNITRPFTNPAYLQAQYNSTTITYGLNVSSSNMNLTNNIFSNSLFWFGDDSSPRFEMGGGDGSIVWQNLSGASTLDQLFPDFNLYLNNNLLGVNTESNSFNDLNTTAEITFYGLTTAEKYLLKNGVRCDDSDICNITQNGTTTIANVASFSNYSTQDVTNSVPVISNLILNSSTGNNYTSENLTAYWSATDDDSDSIKNITNWFVSGTSLAVLNMPFENWGNNGTHNVSNITIDYSTISNNGSIVNAAWNSSGGHGGFGAYKFDGDGDYILLGKNNITPTLAGTSGITFSAWIYPDDIEDGGATDRNNIFDLPINSGDSALYLTLRYGGNIYCGGRSQTGDDFQSNETIDTINIGSWQHIVCMLDFTNDRVYSYHNGTLVGNSSVTFGSETFSPGTPTLPDIIGRKVNADSYFFNGSIDEILIFNRTLSHEQILTLYQNQTNLIVSQETNTGDNWSICVTPNDGNEDGIPVCSQNLTILEVSPYCAGNYNSGNWTISSNLNCSNEEINLTGDLTVSNLANFSLINVTLNVEGIVNISSGLFNVSDSTLEFQLNSNGSSNMTFEENSIIYLDNNIFTSNNSNLGWGWIINTGNFSITNNNVSYCGTGSTIGPDFTIYSGYSGLIYNNRFTNPTYAFSYSFNLGGVTNGINLSSNFFSDMASITYSSNFTIENNNFTSSVELNSASGVNFTNNTVGGIVWLSNDDGSQAGSQNIFKNNYFNNIADQNNSMNNTLTYSNSFGEILWENKSNLTVSTSVSLIDKIFLENNSIGIADDSNLININTSATITFYGLSDVDKYLLKNGVRCDNQDICNITQNGTTTIANVASFSNYSTQENFEPNITIPIIIPATAYTNTTLISNTTYTNNNNDNGTVYFRWYVNSSNIYNQTNSSVQNGTTIVAELAGGNFSKGDQINVSVYANDGSDNSTLNWSNIITIENYAPHFDPAVSSKSASSDNEFFFDINCSDIDGDDVSYFDNSSLFIINESTGAINHTPGELDVGTYNINIICGDGTDNSSAVFEYVISDETSPVFFDPVNSSVGFKKHQLFIANISINDSALDFYKFSTNASGSWLNSSVDISGSNFNASNSTNISLSRGNQICWYFWANDSSSNEASSSSYCFVVENSVPIFNESLVNYSVSASQNFVFDINCSDVDGDTIYYYDNTSLFNINSSNGLINYSAQIVDQGLHSINISCGDQNVNISSIFNLLIIGNPNTTQIEPDNNYQNTTPTSLNVSFVCNATDEINLNNISLYITNSTNISTSFALNQSTNITGTQNSSSWNLTLTTGTYTWNCLSFNNNSLSDWDVNRTFTINQTSIPSTPTTPGGNNGGGGGGGCNPNNNVVCTPTTLDCPVCYTGNVTQVCDDGCDETLKTISCKYDEFFLCDFWPENNECGADGTQTRICREKNSCAAAYTESRVCKISTQSQDLVENEKESVQHTDVAHSNYSQYLANHSKLPTTETPAHYKVFKLSLKHSLSWICLLCVLTILSIFAYRRHESIESALSKTNINIRNGFNKVRTLSRSKQNIFAHIKKPEIILTKSQPTETKSKLVVKEDLDNEDVIDTKLKYKFQESDIHDISKIPGDKTNENIKLIESQKESQEPREVKGFKEVKKIKANIFNKKDINEFNKLDTKIDSTMDELAKLNDSLNQNFQQVQKENKKISKEFKKN
ncbi:hypothetical protein HON01_04205 [Candidatus Woesearchaeota archaeon]|nr:hypothetical protein [Candidatus Woesearchaeota archaeon]MBT7367213.1 hypothetical protein [Candidatus Woesearchaeota archaeon]